jgi:hypothetical protein
MASRRLFDGAQIELGLLPIVGVGGGSYTLSAAGGIYSYSGNNATLTYTQTGSYSLAADGTAYSYSGNNATLLYNRRLVADGAVYSYSGNNASLVYTPAGAYILTAAGGVYNYSGNNATLVYSGGPPPVVEIIGVCGPQVTNIFLFNGITEPPFPVQRRTS